MAGATNIPDLTPEETKGLDQWASNLKDLDPNNAFDALGYSPGFGGYRTHEELTPGFWDNALARAGILTDKMRERQELSQKQQALLPFVKELMDEKIRLRHIMALSPGTDQEVPTEVAKTLGMNQPQAFAEAGGPMAAPSPAGAMGGLQPAPSLGSTPEGQPPMMLRPAPSLGDQAMAGMPLGTPGQIGALSNTQPFAGPPVPGQDPIPFAPLETTGYQNVPEYDPMTGGFRPGLQTVALRDGPPMVEETVRDQPITMADRKQVPQPAPTPAPKDLPLWRRNQVANMLTAQAAGHLMPDETGKLVPSSFMAPDTRSLNDEQQQALAQIYQGGTPAPGVKLPAGPYIAALKGKQDTKAQDVSLPVREYMKANNMPETPQSIEIARQAVRQEKQADEKANIVTRELMQTGPQEVRVQLLKQGTNVVEATTDQVEKAIKDAADQELSVHARKQMQEFAYSGLDAGEKEKLVGLQQVARVTNRLRNEFTPAERREFVGYLSLPTHRLAQIVKANPRFAKFDALLNREGLAAFDTAGKNLTALENKIMFGFLPQGGEWSPENFEAKLEEGDDYARSKIGDIVKTATTNRRDLARTMSEQLPKKEARPSAATRYNQLEKQGMKEADIYNQLVVEGYKP